MYVCMYVCLHAYSMHAYMDRGMDVIICSTHAAGEDGTMESDRYVCMYACIYVCMYVLRMYVCVYVCMYM